MPDQPGAAELLAIARKTLLEELLPTLPKGQRYTALMSANAMAIAKREIETGVDELNSELQLFAELYGYDSVRAAGSEPQQQLAVLNARLAEDIRAHRLSNETTLRALLKQQVLARLKVSNPKFEQVLL